MKMITNLTDFCICLFCPEILKIYRVQLLALEGLQGGEEVSFLKSDIQYFTMLYI